MAYAEWCPNCQNKVPFWSFLADKFNTDQNQKFKIGVISTTDQRAKKIVDELNIEFIPRFMHVTPSGNHGILSEFKGVDHSPESLLSEVCQQKHKLCQFKYDVDA
jgi:thiol-disulfide isomerase/thioredoxin